MRRAPLPLVAFGVVVLLDIAVGTRRWPLPVVGLLDEAAHLLTAWVLLAALGSRFTARRRAWALLGVVLLDLDHIPLYLWGLLAVSPAGRPVTHSLCTVAVLLAAAVPAGLRVPALGLGAGVALHLGRDLATGPGVPLFWPVSSAEVLLPYGVYVAALGTAAVLAARASVVGTAGQARRSR